ncbi:hypothetical protein SLEP1_g20581 [Rubroshorea leprosula]|uniref:Aminotransferase class I/classII large domain-containing protein n=1 Tax=Rubroshorea leprosula TaxID=152421 RepID=A0AAV5J991_9ROSI|nr:hypothetical protein SLEP1_g20581 [Rubroshorea leprosula]
MLVSGLEEAGVECLKVNAGLFCWVDMRKFLSRPTFEAEEELWKSILYSVRLNTSLGSSCHCSEPGWFRVCFANMSEEMVHTGIQRLKNFAELVSESYLVRKYKRGFSIERRLVFEKGDPQVARGIPSLELSLLGIALNRGFLLGMVKEMEEA